MVETMIAAPSEGDGERSEGVGVAGEKPKQKRSYRGGTGREEEYLGLRISAPEMQEIESAMKLAPDCTKSTVVRAILRIGLRALKSDPGKLGEGMIVKRSR